MSEVDRPRACEIMTKHTLIFYMHAAKSKALITTEGGRRASIAQGQALLRLACEAFPSLLPHHREMLRAARDRVCGA